MAQMKISLSNLGKRYNREWIFRHLQFDFDSNQRYAITGSNGSGKSTLMQILAGLIHHNEGTIHHILNGEKITAEKVYQFISFTAPYVDMPDEFSFEELLLFHFQFKRIVDGKTVNELIELSGLKKSAHKQIRFYSSGMKQRARLVLSLFSDTPLLLLDEPCTNLDASGIKWYHDLLSAVSNKRLLVISSNDPKEYVTCGQILSIEDFKRF
jgi:ABC-type multidrug transport system ATPase subunit